MHLIETHHAGGGFFRNTLDRGLGLGEPAGGGGNALFDLGEEEGFLFRLRVIEDGRIGFRLLAEDQIHGRVATIIEDHVGGFAIRPMEDGVGIVPVFLKRLTLGREDRHAGLGNRGGGVVLGREDVARGPAHFSTQSGERLDQDRRLHGHVQRAGNARALQRLRILVFFTQGHQARHLNLGHVEFNPAPFGQRHVLHDIGFVRSKLRHDHQVLLFGQSKRGAAGRCRPAQFGVRAASEARQPDLYAPKRKRRPDPAYGRNGHRPRCGHRSAC